MRKINSILSIIMLVVFVMHMTASGLLMVHVIPYISVLMHTLSGTLILVVAVHTVIGIKLSVDTLSAMKKSDAGYMNDNMIFWARRASGFAVLAFVIIHIIIFMSEKGVPGTFTFFRLLCSILLSLSVLIHVITNIRPLMIGLGRSGRGKGAATLILVSSLLLLASGAAFVVYYINMSL